MPSFVVKYSPSGIHRTVTCESCGRNVELECEGIAGMAGYETYNAYGCPHCRKLNQVRTPGAIISVRPAGVAVQDAKGH